MAVPCKEQKSAVVLSVWHCMLSEFLVKAERVHLGSDQFKDVMSGLYKHMGDIRASIHDNHTAEEKRDVMSLLAVRIKSISTNETLFNRNETWAAEVGFVVQELAEMEALLNQHKDDLCRGSIRSNIMDGMEQQQPRHVACLITLWYWVAAWSDLEGPGGIAKELFLKSVESRSGTSLVDSLLFSPNESLPKDKRENLHDMLSNLLIMLATSPDHWINVVRHFTENMVETSYTIGVISTNIRMNRDNNTGTTSPADSSSRPAPHTRPSKAVQLVRDEVDRRGSCKPVFKKLLKDAPVAHAVDSLPNVIADVWHGVENVGHDVSDVIHGISQTITRGEHLIEDVQDLGHKIGNGLASLFHSIW